MKKYIALFAMVMLSATAASANTISFSNDFQLLASYYSDGLVNWNPSWTWNGQYQTPPDYYRQISSTIQLYTERTDSQTLFVQVTDVISGNGASFWGAAFTAITMTGLVLDDHGLAALNPTYSDQYANPNEYREGTYGDCSQSQNTPLTTTPGWDVATSTSGVAFHTSSGATDGFTGPFGCIYGDFRIINGGIFALNGVGPDPSSLIRGLNVSVVYGSGQTINATPVPEPNTATFLPFFLITGVIWAIHSKKAGLTATKRPWGTSPPA